MHKQWMELSAQQISEAVSSEQTEERQKLLIQGLQTDTNTEKWLQVIPYHRYQQFSDAAFRASLRYRLAMKQLGI